MKKLIYVIGGLMALLAAFVSCDDEETYAEQKERETKQIKKWIEEKGIDVISMSDFLKDTITNNPETGPDITRNEYVLFVDNGVYMQIVREGDERVIEPGEVWEMNARYKEWYVGTGDVITQNQYQRDPDVFTVRRVGDNYTAYFKSGIMASAYGTSVPNAWLMVMPFIKPGTLNGSSAAKVRLIVPHTQGTQTAAQSVYPAFYEIIITRLSPKVLD